MKRARERRRMTLPSWLAAWGVGFGLVLASPCCAHEGPPFPIVMDRPVADYLVSVWADPDIGESRFFVVIEQAGGNGPPPVTPSVSLWVEPIDGRLDRVTYDATQQDLRNQLQFFASPYFDQRDRWRVGVQLAVAGRPTEEVTAQVESTPPGWGAWDLAIYLFPFLLFGGLWVVASVRHRRTTAQQEPPITTHAQRTTPGSRRSTDSAFPRD